MEFIVVGYIKPDPDDPSKFLICAPGGDIKFRVNKNQVEYQELPDPTNN